MSELSAPEGTTKPLTDRQMKAVYMRACGDSWDQISKKLGCTVRTLENWRKHPAWNQFLEAKRKEWVEEYELTFSRMMPEVAQKHRQLVRSQSEAIAMRAVDSAHTNHVRCVKEAETKTEVQELRELVLALTEQLSQQRANG